MKSLFKIAATLTLAAGSFYLGRNWDTLVKEGEALVAASNPETPDDVPDVPKADTPDEPQE